MKRLSLFLLIVLLTSNVAKYTLEAKVLIEPPKELKEENERLVSLETSGEWVNIGKELGMDDQGLHKGTINNSSLVIYEDFEDHLFLNGAYTEAELKFKEDDSPQMKIQDVEKHFNLKHKENDNFVVLKEGDKNKACDVKMNKEKVIERLRGMSQPIDNAVITENPGQMPGAPREYRNGYHEGFDWYPGAIGREIDENTNVYPMYEGKIVKIDHNFEELDYEEREELLDEAIELNRTPQQTLDLVRGRQIWIESENNVLVRYAHLSSVNEDLKVGDEVDVETNLGTTGNSGTSEGSLNTKNDIHLHTDILVCGVNFWQYGDIDDLVQSLVELYKEELSENQILRDEVEVPEPQTIEEPVEEKQQHEQVEEEQQSSEDIQDIEEQIEPEQEEPQHKEELDQENNLENQEEDEAEDEGIEEVG